MDKNTNKSYKKNCNKKNKNSNFPVYHNNANQTTLWTILHQLTSLFTTVSNYKTMAIVENLSIYIKA